MKRIVTITTETIRRVTTRAVPGSTAVVIEEGFSQTDVIHSQPEAIESPKKGEFPMLKALLGLVLMLVLVPVITEAQPFATGLRGPIELAFTNGGNLIVAEGGSAPNTGRVSLIDRATGARRTLVDGLPAGIHQTPQPSVSGPAGLAVQGNALFVVIGSGDAVLPGPVPGTEIANPSPSSPIYSSVLELRGSKPLDAITGNFVLNVGQHATLKSGSPVVLTNGSGEELTIRLVVDFPDYAAEPRPDVPQNVRLSNTFGVAIVGQTLYVVDASQNLMRRADARTGAYTTLTTFASSPNTTGMGGPFVESVPNSVRVRGNDLLVTTLTGFPFPQGKAEVRRVSLDGSSNTTLVTGLTSALDVMPLGHTSTSPMLVIEFSTNQLAGAPGRLRLVSPVAEPVTLAEGLITPTGVAVDQRTGEIFVCHLGPGIITRITSSAIPRAAAAASIPIAGSVDGAFGSRFRSSAQLANPFSYPISGQLVFQPMDGTATSTLNYQLAAFETKSYADLGAALGARGIGAVDVVPAGGGTPNLIVTIADVASASGASVQVGLTTSTDVLSAGTRGVVVAPADAAKTRLNIGIRTFDAPAVILVTERDASGATVRTTTLTLPANWFGQKSAATLLGSAPASGHTLTFAVESGSALVYGASTDNDGNGMALQIARPVPEI